MNYSEIGVTGLKQFAGYVEEAYSKNLYWPGVQPLYSRMRRSDPEVSMVRGVFNAMARAADFMVELPDNPTDKDKAASEFVEQCLHDMDGGETGLIETMVNNVPFFGWGLWEITPGKRDPKWAPPGGDEWRSKYNDGRVGIRRLGWRDSSSFYSWKFADNGKANGMVQYVFPNPQVTLSFEDCLHLTFGDAHNPEGLSPLEAVWRLERIKYGLEIVQGIGFEHAAGHLSVNMDSKATTEDKVMVRDAAKAIMTAQEGNYALWPSGVTGTIVDVPFSAAPSILEAIRYFGIMKLQLFNAQWMALSATSGSGSYSAMSDSSSMFMVTFNSMMDGFAAQSSPQIIRNLKRWNPSVFAGTTADPKIVASPVGKKLSLAELSSILGPLNQIMPLGEDDFKAIRKLTGFLPENLPETDTRKPEPQAPEVQPDQEDDTEPEDERPDQEEQPDEAQAEMQARFARHFLAHPEAMNV